MTRRSSAYGLSLLALLLAFGANAQLPPLELELGFRSVEVEGNEGMYRTQINDEEGILLRYFTLRSTDQRSLFDYYRVDASDLGAGPAGSLRFEAGRTGLYRTRLAYRRADSFSAVPAFANPLLGEGIVPGQHIWDRRRQSVDLDVEILALDHVVPFFGYTWNEYDGPGMTTYHAGQDEFLLHSDLEETGNEFRIGASFTWDRLYGSITQGWRQFDGDEELTLAPGEGRGNDPGNLLGRPVSADRISRLTEVDLSAPFTNLFITGEISDRLRVTGKFVQLDGDSDVTGDETLVGSFVSFPVRVLFDGLEESVTSEAENETRIAGVRGEWVLTDRILITGGFEREDRQLDGSALIRTLYLNSITFGGVDRGDLEIILDAESSLDREEDTIDAAISISQAGPFALFARVARTDQEVTLAPDLSEISVPGSQAGTYERSIDTFEIGATFSAGGFSASGSARKDDADSPILRIDYLERERFRARLAWASPSDRFGAGVTGDVTDQWNRESGFGYDSRIQSYTADAWLALWEPLRVWASTSRFDADSAMTIRNPVNFNPLTSLHREDGDAAEGGFSLIYDPVRIDASYSTFENDGSRPFDVDRLYGRIAYAINQAFGLVAEWENDDYDESGNLFADYEAERIGLYFRWTP